MRNVNNVIRFDHLLNVDGDLEIVTKGILEWLDDLQPYTTKTIREIKKNGIENYITLVNDYSMYVRELTYQDKSKVDLQIKEILKLIYEYYVNNNADFLVNYQRFMEFKHKAIRNMEYLSSKTQSYNKAGEVFVKKKDILMMNMELFKDSIEGILNPQLNQIIYILEHNKGYNPDIENIDKRYFSKKYFNYGDNTRTCNIEKDFPIIYHPSDTSIRNASAHFDYKVDVKRNVVIYNEGSRNNPIETEMSLNQLVNERLTFACIENQISIAYALFATEFVHDLPLYNVHIEFEEMLSSVSHLFLAKKIALTTYATENDALVISIDNLSNMNVRNLLSFLIGFVLIYFDLINLYEDDVSKLIIKEKTFQITFCKETIIEFKDKIVSGNVNDYVNEVIKTVKLFS